MSASLKKMALLPRPRRVAPRAGGLVLPGQGRIVCATDAAQLLPLARMEGTEGALVRDEYANTVRMLRHACQRGLALRQGVLGRSAVKRRLAEDMRHILGEHRRLWMARNREGGLQDSAGRLEARLGEYTS